MLSDAAARKGDDSIEGRDTPRGVRNMTRRHWRDLSSGQRGAFAAMTASQITLAAVAWIDLARRPQEQVRGRKPLWAGAIAVNSRQEVRADIGFAATAPALRSVAIGVLVGGVVLLLAGGWSVALAACPRQPRG